MLITISYDVVKVKQFKMKIDSLQSYAIFES